MALTSTDHVTEETYRRLALGNTQLELYRGQLREKPWMSAVHGDIMMHLVSMLDRQTVRSEYRLRANFGRLRVSSDTYYVPDVVVIPTASVLKLLEFPRALDAYPEPLPLVVEIWSPSTGGYDVNVKLADYQRRGDREIWYIHPYERTLTAWRREPDGMYVETVYRDGTVQPAALPGVTIDLDALFEM